MRNTDNTNESQQVIMNQFKSGVDHFIYIKVIISGDLMIT